MAMLTQAEETSLTFGFGDGESLFTKLYDSYYSRIYNYVHYRIDDYHAAYDLTSQIFEKLYTRLRYYQSEKATFSVWLFTIARNTVIDYYRSQNRTHSISLEIAADLSDTKSTPDEMVVFNEIQQHLLKALTSLSQRERDIIALKFWSGTTNRDIAKLTGISESNIGVILFRAMRRLRIILERQGMNIYG